MRGCNRASNFRWFHRHAVSTQVCAFYEGVIALRSRSSRLTHHAGGIIKTPKVCLLTPRSCLGLVVRFGRLFTTKEPCDVSKEATAKNSGARVFKADEVAEFDVVVEAGEVGGLGRPTEVPIARGDGFL